MKVFTVILKGRRTTAATDESAQGEIRVQAWDRGEARVTVERRIANGLRIGRVKCDEVQVVRIR